MCVLVSFMIVLCIRSLTVHWLREMMTVMQYGCTEILHHNIFMIPLTVSNLDNDVTQLTKLPNVTTNKFPSTHNVHYNILVNKLKFYSIKDTFNSADMGSIPGALLIYNLCWASLRST